MLFYAMLCAVIYFALVINGLMMCITKQVVGMGEQPLHGNHFTFSVKFVAYQREISARLAAGEYAESDVVVLMDAFDVLVFPAIRRIKKVRCYWQSVSVCLCVCVSVFVSMCAYVFVCVCSTRRRLLPMSTCS
jgi:hypothetical protein